MENSVRTEGPTGVAGHAVSSATLAKGALRRLLMAQLEPTPENYTKAYQEESGQSARPSLPTPLLGLIERLMNDSMEGTTPAGRARFMQALTNGKWADASHLLDESLPRSRATRASAEALIIDQIVSGLERPSSRWTYERKRDTLGRMLEGTSPDTNILQQRLRQLLAGWDDQSSNGIVAQSRAQPMLGSPLDRASAISDAAPTAVASTPSAEESAPMWSRLVTALSAAAREGLPADDERCADLSAELARVTERIVSEGPSPQSTAELDRLCALSQRVLQHRHQMLDQLEGLCHELTEGLADLAEDESWARGQCDAMRLKLEDGLTPRGVRAVSAMLKATREKQGELRRERESARTALRGLVNHMLTDLDALGSQTGRFQESVGRYADVIERADSLEGLTDVVREMAAESRQVKNLMTETQQRLNSEHENASSLNARVSQLESELRRLSEEVSTDQLTQVANRRGLHLAFATEKARAERSGEPLAIGLIDVDDFKKLNDKLGHSAGDEALKALAARVREGLRPTDTVARYGGEEFVVILPGTDHQAAVTILNQLQRELTRGLFMHNQQQVFVTFSAGVSVYRQHETLESTLDRADEALYEAKRTGKNRTCVS